MNFVKPVKNSSSYAEIRKDIALLLGRELGNCNDEPLVDILAEMKFELERLRENHKILRIALQSRDVVLRERDPESILPMAQAIEFGARESLDTIHGLHGIEWTGDVAYRWTGPESDLIIRAWVERTMPIVFELCLISYGDERNRGALILTVDGKPVDFAESEEHLLRSAPFPMAASGLFSEIVLHVPFMTGAQTTLAPTPEPQGRGRGRHRRRSPETSPPPDGIPEDARTRGIAFSHMRLLPAR